MACLIISDTEERSVSWPNANNLNNVACLIVSDSEERSVTWPSAYSFNNVACLIISAAEVHDPKENCDMSECPHLLVGWAVGGKGTCFHEGAGVRVGKTAFKKMMIQVLKCITTRSSKRKVHKLHERHVLKKVTHSVTHSVTHIH